MGAFKTIKVVLLSGILALSLTGSLVAHNVVFALERTIEKVSDDCKLVTSAGTVTGKNADGSNATSTNSFTVPDSFAVGRCLSTSGQIGSKFLPINGRNSDGSVVDNTNKKAPDGTENSVRIVLVDAIDTLVKIVATVSLIVFIIGALITIVSGGQDTFIDKGKDAMKYSVIGLAVALFSFIIVMFVRSLVFVS